MNQLYYATIQTIFGMLTAVSDDYLVYLIQFSDTDILKRQLARLQSKMHCKKIVEKQTEPLMQLEQELQQYFSNTRVSFETLLMPYGSDFQKNVWQALMEIPYGSTVSYSDIAKKIGNKKAYRAVGSAVGNNPLAIIIPCHRVIQKNGLVGNYAGGIERKKQLLALEKPSKNLVLK